MIPIISTSLAIAAFLNANTKTEVTPFSGDRPGFTTGPGIVQKGHFQIEVGVHQTAFTGSTTTDFGDGAVLRYGVLADKLEVRLGLPSHLSTNVGGVKTSGFGDSAVGLKYFLTAQKGKSIPAMALLFTDTLGTGRAAFSSARSQPELRLLAQWALDDTHSLLCNLVYGEPTDAATGTKFNRKEVSAAYTYTQGKFSPYIELFGILPNGIGAGNATYTQAGFAYAYTPMLQFDASFAIGLNGPGSDKTFTFGVGFKY